jgi:hypothetical protein
MSRRPLLWSIAAIVVIAATVGLYWFQPWKLVTNSTANDAVPTAATAATGPTAVPAPAPGNVLLAQGTIVSHEHDSSGTARLVRLTDGRVQLVLENLATTAGPDLRVWLTDQPVKAGKDGWYLFDDGLYVEVGALKANRGNQVYDVPAGTDLSRITSVTIWCKRFSVSFAAAPLTA